MKITLNDFYDIQMVNSECKTIGEWKRRLKEYAVKFGLEDRVVVQIAQSHELPFEEYKKLIEMYCEDEVER